MKTRFVVQAKREDNVWFDTDANGNDYRYSHQAITFAKILSEKLVFHDWRFRVIKRVDSSVVTVRKNKRKA